jgi:hypothetical protein
MGSVVTFVPRGKRLTPQQGRTVLADFVTLGHDASELAFCWLRIDPEGAASWLPRLVRFKFVRNEAQLRDYVMSKQAEFRKAGRTSWLGQNGFGREYLKGNEIPTLHSETGRTYWAEKINACPNWAYTSSKAMRAAVLLLQKTARAPPPVCPLGQVRRPTLPSCPAPNLTGHAPLRDLCNLTGPAP